MTTGLGLIFDLERFVSLLCFSNKIQKAEQKSLMKSWGGCRNVERDFKQHAARIERLAKGVAIEFVCKHSAVELCVVFPNS